MLELKKLYESLTASQKASFVEAGVVLIDDYSNPHDFKDKATIWCKAIMRKYGFLKYDWHWMDSMREYDPVTDKGSSTNWIIQFEDAAIFSKNILGPLILFVENGVRGYIINAMSCASLLNTGRTVISPQMRSSKDMFKTIKEICIPSWINASLTRDITKRMGFTVLCNAYSDSTKIFRLVLEFNEKTSDIYSDDIENAINFMSKYMSTNFKMNLIKTADTSYGKWTAYNLDFQPSYSIL
ncbi:hypothetical protein [Ewingella americana]|uniref:Uncharacterized protein n=1 Tax=Ewingella americana TaxID=41202 RepID=A0A502GEQ7_9GAMM|nr:hypothetical protein [Ewingella americana]TPG60018.1 hypothetical protein EAH77_15740 [Ewingella americana]